MPERIIASLIWTKGIKLVALMFLSWAARLAFRTDLTVGLIIRQLIISILVGYVAAEFVLSQTYEEWIKVAVFCSLVFLADDVLVIVLAFGKHAQKNQETLFSRFTKFFIGK
jgi:hypothetical protein